LGEAEKEYLNNYNAKVCEILLPHLDAEEQAFLKNYSAPI
jgi:hypothetical protein